ncbi:hypothetical protein NA78x_002639 [Anatilimnocola sp. NA78]|uniref:hypothetical protein n=1 Tax=Anatilimnocola sp. NA78 TaxID=3415683 RepID=UPI003CE49D1A
MPESAVPNLDPTAGDGARFSLNGVEYVIVRSDLYDKFRAFLAADHQELRDQLALSSADNGWDEPGMDAYDSYPANP